MQVLCTFGSMWNGGASVLVLVVVVSLFCTVQKWAAAFTAWRQPPHRKGQHKSSPRRLSLGFGRLYI